MNANDRFNLYAGLNYIFGCSFSPSYKINTINNTITCYTEDGIIWGKITFYSQIEENIYASGPICEFGGVKMETYFEQHERKNYIETRERFYKILKLIISDIWRITEEDYKWFNEKRITTSYE